MDWAKKIERLLNGRPYADVERAAGIGPTLSVAISRKSDLSVSKAIKIAKALNVPSDWLFDDEQDWPPPEAFPVGSSAAVARIVLPIVFEAFEVEEVRPGRGPAPHVRRSDVRVFGLPS